MYVHSPSLLVAAETFLEAAFKNENSVPQWMMAALKTPNNPVVIDGVIVTTNFADMYGEDDDEFDPPPSYDREEYRHILRRDTKKKSISTTDRMVTTFSDVNRNFRVDVEYYCVLLDNNGDLTAIDVLDTDIHNSRLDYSTEEFMTDWFYDRVAEVEGHLARREKVYAGRFRIVVDNSR